MADILTKTFNFGGADRYVLAPDAANVTEDANHKFVTEAEKAKIHNNPITKDAVLTSTGWSGSDINGFTQTITINGITSDSCGIIGISDKASKAVYEQAVDAILRKTGQGNNTVTVSAYGEKPTVDIPVVVILT